MHLKQYSIEEQNRNRNETNNDVYLVFGARYGSIQHSLDSRLGYFNLKRNKGRWISEASCIPPEWTKKNNFIHEVVMWRDGTALHEFHGTSVGMLLS